LGKLPVAERFFGGNRAEDFIAGDNWRIRGGPLVRSIPENRLNAGGHTRPGRRFELLRGQSDGVAARVGLSGSFRENWPRKKSFLRI